MNTRSHRQKKYDVSLEEFREQLKKRSVSTQRRNILIQKLFLSPHKLNVFNSELEKIKPSKAITFLLGLISPFGFHQFYLKNYVKGFFMMITFGGFGIWSLIDWFFLPSAYLKRVEEIEINILNSINDIDYI